MQASFPNDRRQSLIDVDPKIFREAGHQLVDEISDFLASMENHQVTPAPTPASVREKLPATMPVTGTDPSLLVKETWQLLADNSLLNGHPRFWGYITSSPAPIGMLGDLLAAAINSNCGAFVLSPVATEIEKQTIQWLGQLIGYPVGAGIMVSGGNVANFVGFLAARKAKASWDIRNFGLHRQEGKWRIYTSAETHTWINKAADLFGFGLEAIRWIPINADQKMNVSALEKNILEDKKQGLVPFLVIGTAGSVGTGVVDPLEQIASICKEHECWFHVDGAYGGFAAALPELKDMFRGMELADSIAIDPHKWLYSPLEGCTLVKEPAALTDAFSFHPVYYNFEGKEQEQTNFYESGFQNSRGFRALKVWLEFRHAGAEGHITSIREDIELAKHAFELMSATEEIETFTQHLSITTFRYRPRGLDSDSQKEYLNKLNQQLLDRLQAGGEVFPSNAVLNGNFLLRICIVNFRTTLKDLQALLSIVLTEGKLIHEEMQKEKSLAS